MKQRFQRPNARGGKKVATPRKHAGGSTDHESPVYCFRYLDSDFHVAHCEQADQAALARTLVAMSQLTWGQLRDAGRHGKGFEHLPQDQVRIKIPRHITPDVRLLVFRFSGIKAMLGYRDGRTLHILALDPQFIAYDHGS